MPQRILINASNLHCGGGVAVASSFIHELSLLNPSSDISVLVSSVVDKNIQQKSTATSVFSSYKVIDFYGLSSIWGGVGKQFEAYDLIFTVFGPAYFLFSSKKHVFGFAQPWIVYPRNPVSKGMSFLPRMKTRLKFLLQSLFFSRADELVVELDHVKEGLKAYPYLKTVPTHIVHSTVDSIFYTPDLWQGVDFPSSSSNIKLGLIARNYPHKNLQCLPLVKEILQRDYGLSVNFYVTFPEPEWDECSEGFRAEVHNIGALKLDQCPSFYSQIDGVIFPSLLECFSATPLESMAMEKPIFASDLPFIKDCCHDYANYFDPLNPADIARVVAGYFLEPGAGKEAKLAEAKTYSDSFSSAKGRAESYLKILTTVQ